jgi:hypothetical protein
MLGFCLLNFEKPSTANAISTAILSSIPSAGWHALKGRGEAQSGAATPFAKPQGVPPLRGIIVPSSNAAEAAVVEGLDVVAVDSLAQTVAFLTGELDIEPTPSRLDRLFQELSHYEEDFADVRGQEMAKRAVTIAAADSHNLLTLWSFTPQSKGFNSGTSPRSLNMDTSLRTGYSTVARRRSAL